MVDKEKYKANINGSMEQRRMDAQKRKDLPDGLVFSKVKGVVEMHSLVKVQLQGYDVTVDDFVKGVLADLKTKDNSIKLLKEAVLSLDKRLNKLEKVVKDYGLE